MFAVSPLPVTEPVFEFSVALFTVTAPVEDKVAGVAESEIARAMRVDCADAGDIVGAVEEDRAMRRQV